jgi:hypothetical protein
MVTQTPEIPDGDETTMAALAATTSDGAEAPQSRRDTTLLLLARLMEGGREDEETAADLGKLTKLLDEDAEQVKQGEPSITPVIDTDCVDTIFGFLDMRQPDAVRAQAVLCTTAYLHTAGGRGREQVNEFFHARMQRSTYDDYIVVFCTATVIFPIEYELMAELLMTEGFLASLGPLMRRTWKSKKVETACLEMLGAACLNMNCHAAIYKYCIDWLEDFVFIETENVVETMWELDTDVEIEQGGAGPLRQHCEKTRGLAAVVWTKIMVSEHARSCTRRAAEACEDLIEMED